LNRLERLSERVTLGVGGGGGTGDSAVLEAGLNAWLASQYPNATPAGSTAAGINFPDNPAPGVPVFSGETISGTFQLDGTDTVTEVCMGFGDPTNAICVPVGTDGASTVGSMASLQLTMPPELCADIPQICHDIRCYEFAKTSQGTFTAGSVASLIAACGACDEPSCQSQGCSAHSGAEAKMQHEFEARVDGYAGAVALSNGLAPLAWAGRQAYGNSQASMSFSQAAASPRPSLLGEIWQQVATGKGSPKPFLRKLLSIGELEPVPSALWEARRPPVQPSEQVGPPHIG
jgi:hypothetical protein